MYALTYTLFHNGSWWIFLYWLNIIRFPQLTSWDFSQLPNMGISFNGYFWGFSLVFIFLNKGCSKDITHSVYFTAPFRFLHKLWPIVSCRIHGPCDIFFPFKKYVKSCSKVHKHLYKNIWWENLLYVSHTLRICTLDLL